MKSNSRGQLRSLNHSPVVILNPHEDVIHPLSADRWRMGHKRCDCSQNLLQLLRLQTRQDLMNDVQTNTLPGFISETQTCIIKSICHFPHITRLYMNVTQMNIKCASTIGFFSDTNVLRFTLYSDWGMPLLKQLKSSIYFTINVEMLRMLVFLNECLALDDIIT